VVPGQAAADRPGDHMVPEMGVLVAAARLGAIIGDPLTLVAGILRENFWVFLLLVTICKAARYLVVVTAV
jgi:membrane protein YqaA with SNARE-associated domain